MPYPTLERRRNMVRREAGETLISPSKIRNAGELAFALRFLCDHFTYKQSKAEGVKGDTLCAVLGALEEAKDSYLTDIARQHGIGMKAANGPISSLGQGEIKNPYNFLTDS